MFRVSFILLLACCGAMSATIDVPKLKMLDDREMPAIALGTYLGFDKGGAVTSKDKQLRNVVMEAIDLGYRHFDTAAIYNTEGEVGEAIRLKIDEGVIKREDVFLTTKLWNTHHKREQVAVAMKETLNKTGLDYVDLFLMHWPIALNEDYSHSNTDYLETWRAMEEMVKLGYTKSIGLSNFNKLQVATVLQECTIKPVALQIEVHPQIIQEDLISYAKDEGIIVMGYSPFGSLVKRFGMDFPGPKMDDPVLTSLAQKYEKTPAQIVLRWLVDRNVVPIPKTVSPKRLLENINIFDFKLKEEEIEKINQFNSNTRYTLPSFWQTHPFYPFDIVPDPIPDPFRSQIKS
ncbi:aldo-keto reductase AKR2E4-like isoform X1 [Spodoptera litura]|uniref:Aldo-keto reductase AKR2E4-like isoform X1 n=2 Tax=Spodoptera litura TaxID=69820 RepID=A0A9J7DVY3_SPOLT|nr:aldo-keto reductase AKR2E4-like isoform X1 [Spodoptera litura]